jgi:hypothetical protein
MDAAAESEEWDKYEKFEKFVNLYRRQLEEITWRLDDYTMQYEQIQEDKRMREEQEKARQEREAKERQYQEQ